MKIPIYVVKVPEYKLKVFKGKSKKMTYNATPWYGVKVPKVYWDNKPDFEMIGRKIDKCLKKHFLGKKIAVRVLGSEDHKRKSVNELIKIIKKLGHDRYDSKRKGDRYENLDDKKIDFFALDFVVKREGNYFKDFLEPFYFWPISENEKPTRIDIVIIYSRSKLRMVKHRYKGREKEIKKDGFVFKDPKKKKEALVGIIKIL